MRFETLKRRITFLNLIFLVKMLEQETDHPEVMYALCVKNVYQQ